MLTGLWWSIWWPWMVVWLVTAGGLLGLVALGVAEVRSRGRSRRRRRAQDHRHQICVYLREEIVMDQYKAGEYGAALSREVQEKVNKDKNGTLSFLLPFFKLGGGGNVSTETITTYLQKAEPISVITLLLNALAAENNLIRVNLADGSVGHNEALEDLLHERGLPSSARALRKAPPRIRLHEVGDFFVLVRGEFRKVDDPAGRVVLAAPYGPDGDGSQPRVQVVCVAKGLRDEVPTDVFWASCLGKVSGWRGQDARLDLEAIALFR